MIYKVFCSRGPEMSLVDKPCIIPVHNPAYGRRYLLRRLIRPQQKHTSLSKLLQWSIGY